jgi:metal-responsive CopG/Arc/MetJ family transcriptional regulator
MKDKTKDPNKRIAVSIPDHVKKELAQMSEETGIAQAQLITLATISLVVNYREKGSFIFADLLNPEHKKN